jgi:RNA recognition motif-containing protein
LEIKSLLLRLLGITSDKNKTIYVGNLNYSASVAELKGFFSDFGVIESARVIKDPASRQSKGFGFVTFKRGKDAKKALAADGQRLKGRSLRVSVAKEQPAKTDR